MCIKPGRVYSVRGYILEHSQLLDWQAGRIAVRTHWFDHRIRAALTEAGAHDVGGQLPRQVVLLGAGMDTRPWRDVGFPPGEEPRTWPRFFLFILDTCSHTLCCSCSDSTCAAVAYLTWTSHPYCMTVCTPWIPCAPKYLSLGYESCYMYCVPYCFLTNPLTTQ